MSRSEPEPTEIIRPVKIPGKNRETGKSFLDRHRWTTVGMLAFALLFTVVGGALFLRYLAEHPLEPAKAVGPERNAEPRLRGKPTAAEKAPAMRKDRPAEATDAVRSAPEKEDAEPRPADIGEDSMATEKEDGREAPRKSLSAGTDPAEDSARRDGERPGKTEAVTWLLKSGKGHEKTGNLAFAHTDYQEALRLDPESREAREALSRVQAQIKDQEFQRLMADGMTAFEGKDFLLARDKWLQAKSFRPESQEAEKAIAQVDQAIRSAQLETLREKAMKAESSENWEEALESYLALLNIDPNLPFAVQGKERSAERIRIEKRMEFFLQNPDALASDRQLENAVLLAREVESIEPKGPRLTARSQELTQRVQAARVTVRLTIESDNLTEVTLYKVGRLGRFALREFDLRPGTYTVVGARDGYQDVRQQIEIEPGQGPQHITIKCTVQI